MMFVKNYDQWKNLFKPASGLVIELYRNSLLAEQEIKFPFGYCEIALQKSEENLLKNIHQDQGSLDRPQNFWLEVVRYQHLYTEPWIKKDYFWKI